jgi:spore coat polysaccharide biosynthesis protein SpsF
MGHVYRSLAIADALRASSRADIAFLMKAEHRDAIVTVSSAGYRVLPALAAPLRTLDEHLLEHVRDFAPEILINDLHKPVAEADYLRALANLGATTVNLVDTPNDLESIGHYEQVIISVMQEARETPEDFYSGPQYAILREHFQGREKEVRETPRMVLLTFGGSDPLGLTVKAARALSGLDPEVEVVAVAGPAFSCREAFEALQPAMPRRVPLIQEAGGHIADLMLAADVVLCSGGMTVYEIAALGTPGIVLGQNTREDARMRAFAAQGTIEYLGLGTDVDETHIAASAAALLRDAGRRRQMSDKGRALVDGMGAARAAEAVLKGGRRGAESPGGRSW